MSDPLMRSDRIGVRLGGRWLFRNVSLRVRPGDCLIVTGPNGSGKSTLVRTLAGLRPPTEGVVFGSGRHSVGYAALDLSLYAMLSPREQISLVADSLGLAVDAESWLERFQLSHRAEVPTGVLSTGQRARLKLLLAALRVPSVLILDEPSVALDEAGHALLAEVIQEQKQRGGLVLATNEPEDKRFGTHQLALG